MVAGVCALGLGSGTAGAVPVVILGAHGKSVVRDDPFLNLPAVTPPPAGSSSAIRPRAHQSARRNAHSELARLRRIRAISAGEYRRYLGSLDAAAATARHLTGTRAVELNAVLA